MPKIQELELLEEHDLTFIQKTSIFLFSKCIVILYFFYNPSTLLVFEFDEVVLKETVQGILSDPPAIDRNV